MEMDNIQSDVQQSTEQVPSSDSSTSSAPSQNDTTGQASPAAEQTTPFHQHPRFQELVQQRRDSEERAKAIEARYTELEQRIQQMQTSSAKQEDPLLTRLKQIDPEFGSRFEKLAGLESQVEQVNQWRQEMQMEQDRQQASQNLSDLYKQYNVSDSMRTRYEREIKALAYENPNLGIKDLPNVFKAVHEDFTKWQDEFRRKERESYVTDKNASKTPQSVTGGTAPAGSKPNTTPMSKQDAIDQMVKEMRAAKQKI